MSLLVSGGAVAPHTLGWSKCGLQGEPTQKLMAWAYSCPAPCDPIPFRGWRPAAGVHTTGTGRGHPQSGFAFCCTYWHHCSSQPRGRRGGVQQATEAVGKTTCPCTSRPEDHLREERLLQPAEAEGGQSAPPAAVRDSAHQAQEGHLQISKAEAQGSEPLRSQDPAGWGDLL